MTDNQSLAQLKQIAEMGRERPLMGGYHLLLWGCLLAIAFGVHWAILTRLLSIETFWLIFLWLATMLLGSSFSWRLDRQLIRQSATLSHANLTENSVWSYSGTFLGIFAVSLGGYCYLSGDPTNWQFMSVMVPVSFGIYAIALCTSHQAAPHSGLAPFGWLSFGLCSATALLTNQPEQYLVAAIGLLLVSILPGAMLIKRAKRAADHG